ncbi:MAG: MBL fold metallo-hydrolase [Syntrophales bacterium LBB04]|nr:MBL fold metallo-hydrolase [Syntrophales bacterium LBB04]
MQEKHFGPIWFIPGKNRGKYPYCHSLYVEGPGILIDPASDRERLIALKKGPGIREIWLSHWHEDHLMYLDLFEDIPLVMPRLDTPPLADIEVFMDWYGIDKQEHRDEWRAFLRDQFHFRPRFPQRFLEGHEVFDLGTVTMEVMHTPGHTPGHLAFFSREPRVLFMGDYDLGKFGPWYGDCASSIEDTIASVSRLRSISARTWITGHETGLFENDPDGHWDRYLGIIDQREEKLLAYLHQPRSMEHIIHQWIIYRKRREPLSFFEFGERGMMSKHLDRLIRQGKVTRENNHYMRV